jgi:hypothetical protein
MMDVFKTFLDIEIRAMKYELNVSTLHLDSIHTVPKKEQTYRLSQPERGKNPE